MDEDVIEMLREHHQEVAVPLELPDEDLLVEIEEELLVSLPHDYKQFLMTVSDVILGGVEPATVCDPTSHTHLPELAATAWERGLDRVYIPICESANGFYCLDEDGAVVHVVGIDSAENVTTDTWRNIWSWAEDVWMGSSKH